MKVLVNERLSKNKMKTSEGYLICTDAILARTGKQQYMKKEVWRDCEDRDSIIDIDRPYDEVFSEATLASFENKPVTVEHPTVDVNSENWKDYQVGFVRDVHQGKVDGQDVILGTLVIQDKQTIDEILNGEHTDLSCGYDCDIVDEDNPKQTNIRGNHVALCQQGRAGIARIVDTSKLEDEDYHVYTFEYDKYEDDYFPTRRKKKVSGKNAYDAALKLNEKNIEIIRVYKDNKLLESFTSRKSGEWHGRGNVESLKGLDNIEDAQVDPSIVDASNYVINSNGIWFARAKGEKDLLTKAYCSADNGETWHTCTLETKSSNNDNRTQGGKYIFRTSQSKDYNGIRSSIGRNVLTWCAANGEHKLQSGYEIDHIDGNYTNDRLSNLEKVSHSENIKRMQSMRKKDSVNDYSNKSQQIYLLCKKYDFYTGGTVSEYNNLLNNCDKMNLDDIAYDILKHSNYKTLVNLSIYSTRNMMDFITKNTSIKDSIEDAIISGIDDWVIKEAEDIVRSGFDDIDDLRSKIQDLSDDLTSRNISNIIDYLKKKFRNNFEDSINDIEPRTDESEEDFIKRFMEEMKSEYPDHQQRLAIAYSYWRNKDMKDSINDSKKFEYRGIKVWYDEDEDRWIDSDGNKYMGYLEPRDIKYYIDQSFRDSVKDSYVEIIVGQNYSLNTEKFKKEMSNYGLKCEFGPLQGDSRKVRIWGTRQQLKEACYDYPAIEYAEVKDSSLEDDTLLSYPVVGNKNGHFLVYSEKEKAYLGYGNRSWIPDKTSSNVDRFNTKEDAEKYIKKYVYSKYRPIVVKDSIQDSFKVGAIVVKDSSAEQFNIIKIPGDGFVYLQSRFDGKLVKSYEESFKEKYSLK